MTNYSKQDKVAGQTKQLAASHGFASMRFSERIRDLRQAKNLTQRDLGASVGVEFSYISKIENEKLDFGDVPSERLIQKLAEALDADEYELLVLAEKVPPEVRKRLFERPNAFRVLVGLDDQTLDGLVSIVNGVSAEDNRARKAK